MVTADEVFERGGDPHGFSRAWSGAALCHLIIEGALRFSEDGIVSAFHGVILEEKQSGHSPKRFRQFTKIRERVGIEKTGNHQAARDSAFIAGAINLFRHVSIKPAR